MTRPVLHIICQAHLDPVWLWSWREGAAEALTTVQSACDRLDEFPDMRFTRSSAWVYRLVQETDPALWKRIRAHIAAGRWETIGGWIEQPDCNLPSTESFARHTLYGVGWMQRETGCTQSIGYNPDSFGHAAGLPQLLRLSGMGRYACMRPGADQRIPKGAFWWESTDGSRVLVWHLPRSYGQHPWCDGDSVERDLRAAATEDFVGGLDHAAFFLGVGDHGGGPTRRQLERVMALRGDPTLPELRFGTLGDFFAAIEASPAAAQLPVVRHGLNHCLRGTYVATGAVKQANRRGERNLVRAEALGSLAGLAIGRPAPDLQEAWWDLLFNQFHDTLAGTCVPSTWESTRDQQGAAIHRGAHTAFLAAVAVARRIALPGGPGSSLAAVNHLPWPRRALVSIDTFAQPEQGRPIVALESADGTRHPLQWLPSESLFGPFLAPWGGLGAVVDLPAGGWGAWRLSLDGDAPVVADPVVPPQVEAGGLTRLDDLLAGPVHLLVTDDADDTWGFSLRRYGEAPAAHGEVLQNGLGSGEGRKRELLADGRPTLERSTVLASGPLVALVRQTYRWRASTILVEWMTVRGRPGVEVRIAANWQEPRQVLLIEVPTALTATTSWARVAGGVEQRPTDGGEEPAQDWLALEGDLHGRRRSLGVVLDAACGYSLADGVLRVPLARNAVPAEHPPVVAPESFVGPYTDQGWNRHRLWLLPGADWRSLDLPRRAAELVEPVEALIDAVHPGDLPASGSAIAINAPGCAMLAIKPAEHQSGALAIRLQECHGASGEAQVTVSAWNRTWRLPVRPWTIHTWIIARDAEPVAADLLERAI